MYAKSTKVLAKEMAEPGELETVIKGVKETSRPYQAGDYIIQNPTGERYALDRATFTKRYLTDAPEPATTPEVAAEGFQLFVACGHVWAHQVTQAECDASFPSSSFMAAWGEPMRVEPGDFLCMPSPAGGEVYRIAKDAFAETYAAVSLDQGVRCAANGRLRGARGGGRCGRHVCGSEVSERSRGSLCGCAVLLSIKHN